jgi:Na+/melibiose symporter-like transporter
MGAIIEKKTGTGTEQKKIQGLPFGIKLSYGLGDISNNIFIVTTGMYLLFFMTNVVGVSPALAMPLVGAGGGDAAGFQLMGIIFGVGIVIFCLVCFFGNRTFRAAFTFV